MLDECFLESNSIRLKAWKLSALMEHVSFELIGLEGRIKAAEEKDQWTLSCDTMTSALCSCIV